jgi:hypothetical protein
MNPDTLNTYANLFLLLAVVGGVGFALYRLTRKKPVEPRDVPKQSFRPKTKDSEEVYEGPPITDWKDMPARNPIPSDAPKVPTFRPVNLASKAPAKAMKTPKSYRAD